MRQRQQSNGYRREMGGLIYGSAYLLVVSKMCVDKHSDDDDGAQECFLQAPFAADLNQPVTNDGQQGRAEQCTQDGALTAKQGRAANDDGGDDGQLHAGAGCGGNRTEMGETEGAGK